MTSPHPHLEIEGVLVGERHQHHNPEESGAGAHLGAVDRPVPVRPPFL